MNTATAVLSTMTTSTMIASVSSSAMASSTQAASNSGMDMSNTCKISMTWNWYTIGACFISNSWQITSASMFAGSCIGVVCLVIALEFLRRLGREYDGSIRRQDSKRLQRQALAVAGSESSDMRRDQSDREQEEDHLTASEDGGSKNGRATHRITAARLSSDRSLQVCYRVGRMVLVKRQFIRSTIHMAQFAVAYFIMLLAMYYNGYIIISIILGAFLGSFIFSWDQMSPGLENGPADVTGCCG